MAAKKIIKTTSKKRNTIGMTEFIILYSPDGSKSKKIKAKIDTGAQSNSIDKNLALSLDVGPAKRTTVVKSANGRSLRPVVYLTIEINGKELRGRFTIADRQKMNYNVLIGKNILAKSGFIIDPSRE